jgi:integrase
VKLDPFAVAAIRLLILTGARLREILDAKWQQVDMERGIIFLPDSKTGKKPVYLSAAAQAVLAVLPRIGWRHRRLRDLQLLARIRRRSR